jgi:hypothetical protein
MTKLNLHKDYDCMHDLIKSGGGSISSRAVKEHVPGLAPVREPIKDTAREVFKNGGKAKKRK